MKVKCVSNKGSDLSKENINAEAGYGVNTIFNITANEKYTVYGIAFVNNCMWYFIAEDIFGKGRNFPMWYPAELFVITSNELSKTWVINKVDIDGKGDLIPFISFPEWANDDEYYGRLVDGDKEDYETFMKYKKIMDEE